VSPKPRDHRRRFDVSEDHARDLAVVAWEREATADRMLAEALDVWIAIEGDLRRHVAEHHSNPIDFLRRALDAYKESGGQ
jgi:hypothetical protein